VPAIDEVVVLYTCNRVEAYAAASGPAGQVTGLSRTYWPPTGRSRSATSCGWPAPAWRRGAEHLFPSRAGWIDAVGEDQSSAQIKAAAARRQRGNHRPLPSPA